MKVLLRRWNETPYVWKDATYKGVNCCVNGRRIDPIDAVSVLDDEASQYVQCSVCKAIFPVNSEEARVHISQQFSIEKCYKCKYLKQIHDADVKYTFVPKPDGKFEFAATGTTILRCQAQYPYKEITNPDAQMHCALLRCNGAELRPVKTFFTEYPGAFDTIITVDRLLECGLEETSYNSYAIKGRNQLFATVNELGIVDSFCLFYRRRRYSLFYSKKYNKCFYQSYGKYKLFANNEDSIPVDTVAYITKKIAALYDGIEVAQ